MAYVSLKGTVDGNLVDVVDGNLADYADGIPAVLF